MVVNAVQQEFCACKKPSGKGGLFVNNNGNLLPQITELISFLLQAYKRKFCNKKIASCYSFVTVKIFKKLMGQLFIWLRGVGAKNLFHQSCPCTVVQNNNVIFFATRQYPYHYMPLSTFISPVN